MNTKEQTGGGKQTKNPIVSLLKYNLIEPSTDKLYYREPKTKNSCNVGNLLQKERVPLCDTLLAAFTRPFRK